jgi:Beta-propeller repeat
MMKQSVTLILTKLALVVTQVLFLSNAHAYLPNFNWATGAGGNDVDFGNAIALDTAGNTYVAGQFQSLTAQFGNITLTNSDPEGISKDIFIAKFDASGNVVWAKSAGGGDSSDDVAYGISVDGAGNCYITGSFYLIANFDDVTLFNTDPNNAAFIAKYNSMGSVVWVRKSSGTIDAAGYAIATTSDGTSYVTGRYKGSIDFGAGPISSAGNYDAFAVKYDSLGNVIWAKGAGGSLEDRGTGIAVDASGNCYVTGYNLSAVASFSGVTVTNSGSKAMFATKYDSSGNVVWAKGGSGNNVCYGNGIAVDNQGNSYVTGNFGSVVHFGGGISLTNNDSGSGGIFVTKYDAAGGVFWANQAGGANDNKGLAIAVDGAGYVYASGYFSGTANFGNTNLTSIGTSDAFISKYDFLGNPLWTRQAGGVDGNAAGLGIKVDSGGNSFLAGYCTGGNFGNITATNFGTLDVFVARIDAPPLTVARSSNNQFDLTWPVLAGTNLQSVTSLTASNDWQSVPYVSGIIGDQYSTTINSSSDSKFFRVTNP